MLRLQALGFCIALGGVALMLLAVETRLQWVAVGAMIRLLAGWSTGMIGVVRGWVTMFRRRRR